MGPPAYIKTSYIRRREGKPTKRFEIDPIKGPDAAEDLPDEEFARLLQIVTWELAMRTSREQFDDQIRHIAMQRSEAEQKLVLAQTAREQRRFAAEVMNDISQLPTMGEPSHEPTTGMYL